MKKIEIFDPAMCCSTGVCGPSIDHELLRIATTINWLKEKGINIRRYGLSNEPHEFIANKSISDMLQKEGADILPVTLVDGEVAKIKEYPSNEELSEWLEVEIKTKGSEEKSEGKLEGKFEEKAGCGCDPKGCC